MPYMLVDLMLGRSLDRGKKLYQLPRNKIDEGSQWFRQNLLTYDYASERVIALMPFAVDRGPPLS